jgi:hypothetical protein
MGGLQHQDQGEFLFPPQPFLQQVATQIEAETERETHYYLVLVFSFSLFGLKKKIALKHHFAYRKNQKRKTNH